jgi:hypothetical protein
MTRCVSALGVMLVSVTYAHVSCILTFVQVDRHVRLLDQAIREQEARVPPELRPRSSFSIIAPIQQSPGGPSYPNPIPNVGSGLDALVAAAQQGAEVELLPGAAEKSSSRSHRKGHRRKVSESARQKAGEAPDVASGDPNIPTSAGALANLSDVPGGVPEFVLTDMPIDPHEPRYCYCNQVSWGEVRCKTSKLLETFLLIIYTRNSPLF